MAVKKVFKFYATWCGPCKIYGKTWDKVIPDYSDQVEFISVNIDKDNKGLANKYKVDSIPHTVLVKEDGSTVEKNGRLSKNELTELILS
jgi:thioredoxin-like negative regulator of GroEL|tara:strand:+ start:1988 stop:2254 length:267 start_codon:yes stop_codon:yes gene_type:complete